MQSAPAQSAVTWIFDLLRNIVTLIRVGVLMGWLTPHFMKKLTEKIQARPLASINWGIGAFVGFFLDLWIVLAIMIIGEMLFNVLTLEGLTITTIWFGICVICALMIFFLQAVAFVPKIEVAQLGGKLLLDKFNPKLAEKIFVSLPAGVFILAVLVGLGAIQNWSNELWQTR